MTYAAVADLNLYFLASEFTRVEAERFKRGVWRRSSVSMARPKNFTRNGVLANALSVFWQHGFADTSLASNTISKLRRREVC